MLDPTMRQQVFGFFLAEAQDLLKSIEQDLLTLQDDRSPAILHNLMRSAHTLKGGAASINLDAIKNVAHVMEDVFTALLNSTALIDAEVEALLFQEYECLRLLLMAQTDSSQVDEVEVLNRAATVMAQIQMKVGDCFNSDAPPPTSADLGVDMVQTLFQRGVQSRLEELDAVLMDPEVEVVRSMLAEKAEVFRGIAESMNLPGFGAIAHATIAALQAHPDQAIAIAELALQDFSAGAISVLGGDRTSGGTPSDALKQLAEGESSPIVFPLKMESGTPFIDGVKAEVRPTMLSKPVSDELLESSEQGNPPINSPQIEGTELSLDQLFGAYQAVEPETQDDSVFDLPTSASGDSSVLANSLEDGIGTQNHRPVSLQSTLPLSQQSSSQSLLHSSTQLSPSTLASHAIAQTVRVDLTQLERLNHLAGELLIGQNTQLSQDEQGRTLLQAFLKRLRKFQQTMSDLRDWSDQQSAMQTQAPLGITTSAFSSFDTLEMDRYSELDRAVQTALDDAVHLESLAEAVEQATKQSKRSLRGQQRLLTQLRDDLTNVRMQPLGELLNRFPRVLQQLATTYGKAATLTLKGTEVLVDKAIVEKLYDPLLHLIRNAFDHGIEAPTVRRSHGKVEAGSIEIHAFHQGNRTVIHVKDDGQGVNLDRVAKRGIELGLITEAQLKTLTTEQVLDLLFVPGFSTASQLSDLSGRGVGLDVVRAQLQLLKGVVKVNSVPQQGTTFSLEIPLSLMITKLLICRTQGIDYALPVDSIEQVVLAQTDQIKTQEGQNEVRRSLNSHRRLLHWQEREIPVQNLTDLLHYSVLTRQLVKAQTQADPGMRSPVILLQTTTGLQGLQVDQVVGEQELVIRPLESDLTPPAYVYGGCTLSNSRLALVLNPDELLKSASSERTPNLRKTVTVSFAVKQEATVANSSPLPTRILLVDDSITLRQVLTLTLQKAGYQVFQAGDGLEALVELRHNQSIDLILCDVEMPGLNGFEFLGQLRQDASFSKIPVVMLTSRSNEKYRQIANDLGAAAYLTKPYTDSHLLTTLTQILQPQPALA